MVSDERIALSMKLKEGMMGFGYNILGQGPMPGFLYDFGREGEGEKEWLRFSGCFDHPTGILSLF